MRREDASCSFQRPERERERERFASARFTSTDAPGDRRMDRCPTRINDRLKNAVKKLERKIKPLISRVSLNYNLAIFFFLILMWSFNFEQ